MALTDLQRRVCRLVAGRIRESGDSYLAGGVALNEALRTGRISRDLDIFHDSLDALHRAAKADRETLASAGLTVLPHREVDAIVEVLVRDGDGNEVIVEWVEDSDFRFFPLVASEQLGTTMDPLDLATNKLRALTNRREVRDWLDVVACHERLQPLGYLVWALHAKDLGLTPSFTLDLISRRVRFSRDDVGELIYEGAAPDFESVSRSWRAALDEAQEIVDLLPPEAAETCVLDRSGAPFRGSPPELRAALASGELVFHAGARGGRPRAVPGSAPR